MRRMMLTLTLLLAGAVWAQTTPPTPHPVDLTPFLQGEVNEIAILTAQSQDLQQRDDSAGAALLQSYIPDHQQQADRLRTFIRARGGNPNNVIATVKPVLGTRLAMVRADETAHALVVSLYRALLASSTDPDVHTLALLGLNGATRHYNSLVVARASAMCTLTNQRVVLMAALALERGAVADLRNAADRLTALGDTTNAGTLQALIPPHQLQMTRLEGLLASTGGTPPTLMVAPTAPLATSDQILAAAHTENLQFASTYALALTTLSAGPINSAFAQGRAIASQEMANLENRTAPPA